MQANIKIVCVCVCECVCGLNQIWVFSLEYSQDKTKYEIIKPTS